MCVRHRRLISVRLILHEIPWADHVRGALYVISIFNIL